MRADSLAPGSVVDTLGGPAMVLALSFTGERTTVHNISVEGNPNYFVGPDGVWVHNCGPTWDMLLETADHLLSASFPDELEWLLSALEADGMTRDGGNQKKSDTPGRVRLHDSKGHSLRFHPGGTRADAAHFGGDPYWTVSDGQTKRRIRVTKRR
jgi:hypothetical protein